MPILKYRMLKWNERSSQKQKKRKINDKITASAIEWNIVYVAAAANKMSNDTRPMNVDTSPCCYFHLVKKEQTSKTKKTSIHRLNKMKRCRRRTIPLLNFQLKFRFLFQQIHSFNVIMQNVHYIIIKYCFFFLYI